MRDFGEVFALSLPGFRWTKLNDEKGRSRIEHDCVYSGKSQILSLGGVKQLAEQPNPWAIKDPYPRGIAIFDVNQLEWKDHYDAGADEYQAHEKIRSWYDQE